MSKRKAPHVVIEIENFKSGNWWSAGFWSAAGYVTSGYCRSRAVAVRKLRRELDKLENEMAFTRGFLGKDGGVL